VCWYHHHIAIHMLGMTIDPNSPVHRRRLIGWRPTTGPPRPQPTGPQHCRTPNRRS
jgi:hypothetical protein